MEDKKINKTTVIVHAGCVILNVLGYKLWNKPLFLVVVVAWFILMIMEIIYLMRGSK